MNAEIKPDQIRLGEHTDYGSVSLLFQRDVGGLEVLINLCFMTLIALFSRSYCFTQYDGLLAW